MYKLEPQVLFWALHFRKNLFSYPQLESTTAQALISDFNLSLPLFAMEDWYVFGVMFSFTDRKESDRNKSLLAGDNGWWSGWLFVLGTCPSQTMQVSTKLCTQPKSPQRGALSSSGLLREFARPWARLHLGPLCHLQTKRLKTGGQYSKVLRMPLNWAYNALHLSRFWWGLAQFWANSQIGGPSRLGA